MSRRLRTNGQAAMKLPLGGMRFHAVGNGQNG
jgi:hypothetical protein